MNVIIGVGIIVIAAGLAASIAGMFLDRDALMFPGLALAIGVLVLGLAGFGVAVVFGYLDGPRTQAGHCYVGVTHFNGKTNTVALEEMPCSGIIVR